MIKHTKIVATISDQRCEVDFIQTLHKSGMDVVRMNTAHLQEEGLSRIVNNVRQVSDRIGILMDTKGPEIRTTILKEPIAFKTGDKVKIGGNPEGETTREMIYVSYRNFVSDLHVGSDILIDDGDLELKVTEKYPDYLLCEAQNDATLGSRKSVNVPGARINLPSLTERDRLNIQWAIDNDLDFIAHSFVRTKQDVLDIQRILDERNSPIKIIAKIENQEGVDNIDEILEAAYGIMIARGDLGIEVPAEKIPGIQRVLIRKCVEVKKPVIVATQMLHSMINNPRPTRAEVTDIANAIYYRTDALMLSGETAYGKYPVEAVQTMAKVAREAEKTKLAANDIRVPIAGTDLDVTSFLAKQAVKSSSKLHVKAIITDSHSGRTARFLAAFRGTSTVYAICYNQQVMRMLSLSYGIWADYQPWHEGDSRRKYFFDALNELIKSGHITRNNMVAYLSGSFGEGGGTTFLEINNVSKVLDAGKNYSLPTFNEIK
ncbi:pyruvate kinase [Parabacteroides sp. PF5-9]|nr:pyruvate kinase [Parabacteroides sp. PF5-9]